MQIRAFEEGDTESVVALWRLCGLTRPWNDPHRDIARKLEIQRELFLVGVEEGNGAVIASIRPATRGTGAGSITWRCIRTPAARATDAP